MLGGLFHGRGRPTRAKGACTLPGRSAFSSTVSGDAKGLAWALTFVVAGSLIVLFRKRGARGHVRFWPYPAKDREVFARFYTGFSLLFGVILVLTGLLMAVSSLGICSFGI